jgi:aromatic ring-opening dioxygenase LigB subunit
MPVVFAAVVPHGWLLIDSLDPSAGGANQTRDSLRSVGRTINELGVETVVIITPHGIRVEGAVAIAGTSRAAGLLRHETNAIEMNVPLDPVLSKSIVATAKKRGLPVATVGFAGNSWEESTVPLDWGTLVPLWFLGHDSNPVGRGDVLADPPDEDKGPAVVIVAPSRVLPRETLVAFGAAIADAASAVEQSVAIIASCDWSHTHKGGRYGESELAAEVDATVVAALAASDPGRLIDLADELVDAAAIDGLWQALMLAGVFTHLPMTGGVLSYECPPIFATGMVVATFKPAGV